MQLSSQLAAKARAGLVLTTRLVVVLAGRQPPPEQGRAVVSAVRTAGITDRPVTTALVDVDHPADESVAFTPGSRANAVSVTATRAARLPVERVPRAHLVPIDGRGALSYFYEGGMTLDLATLIKNNKREFKELKPSVS